MDKDIPGPLWIAIVSLGLMVVGKIVAAFGGRPVILIDAVLSGALLVGIVLGRKWAYVLTFVSVVLGTATGLSKNVGAGITILVVDCLVLVPVLICTSYFFPKSHPFPAEQQETARRA
jgi:hypothetical protein